MSPTVPPRPYRPRSASPQPSGPGPDTPQPDAPRSALAPSSSAAAHPLAALASRLGHDFRDPRLLERAITHRSFSADHNERLEFLGDSVLNLAVAALLYERLGTQTEGDLSRVRASLVRQDTLHRLAQGLEIAGALRLGEGEMRSGGDKRPSILADALEALIGAVYLDGGYTAADALVRRLFAEVQVQPSMSANAKDPKTELQEWLQGRKMRLPVYTVAATLGAAHKQTFDVRCDVQDAGVETRGIGASRRAGEQAAAAAALIALRAKAGA